MTKIAITMLMLLLLTGYSHPAESSQLPELETAQPPAAAEAITSAIPESEDGPQMAIKDTQGKNILVAYFSRTGENYDVGYIEKGNTSIVADIISEQTGGKLFEIHPVVAYPENYDEATKVAKQEQAENARPELADNLEAIADYDVVFIGYPIWWGDMPMAVYTFLESHDFSDKTIVPFCTHAGSGLSSTESRIAALFPNATVLDGLAIPGSTAQNDRAETERAVTEWLQQNGMAE